MLAILEELNSHPKGLWSMFAQLKAEKNNIKSRRKRRTPRTKKHNKIDLGGKTIAKKKMDFIIGLLMLIVVKISTNTCRRAVSHEKATTTTEDHSV